jgi:hypothetical protein
MKGSPLPLHAASSHNRGDVSPASPHPPDIAKELKKISRIMLGNATELANIKSKMQEIYDLFINSYIPIDSAEYKQAIREARAGNIRPLKEFLKKTKGMIPDEGERG